MISTCDNLSPFESMTRASRALLFTWYLVISYSHPSPVVADRETVSYTHLTLPTILLV